MGSNQSIPHEAMDAQLSTVGSGMSPSYGILVTTRSYALSERKQINSRHAKFLSQRVAGHRLPTELVDLIADCVLDLQCETALQVWEKITVDDFDSADARLWKFEAPKTGGTRAEQLHRSWSQGGGCMVKHVTLTKPDGSLFSCIHLSFNTEQLAVASLVPDSTPEYGGPPVDFAGGRVYAERVSRSLMAEFVDCRTGGQDSVKRMTQVDGIEEAIRLWDQEAMDRVVEARGLDVIDFEGEEGGGNRPRLRFSQLTTWY